MDEPPLGALVTATGLVRRASGNLQRDGQIVHIIAQKIEDITPMLDRLPETD